MSALTPEQRAKLQQIANEAMGTYASLPIEDVLNRIHLLTNRPYDGCIKGLEMMLGERLLKANFVEGLERMEKLKNAVAKAMPIIVAMDTQLVKTEVILDGPTDEADDDGFVPGFVLSERKPVRKAPDLSHVNANF